MNKKYSIKQKIIDVRTLQKIMDSVKIEKIAELEHEQWMSWSKEIAKTEKISPSRLKRWKKLWISYSELTEEQKEQDRIWARKVIKILEE